MGRITARKTMGLDGQQGKFINMTMNDGYETTAFG